MRCSGAGMRPAEGLSHGSLQRVNVTLNILNIFAGALAHPPPAQTPGMAPPGPEAPGGGFAGKGAQVHPALEIWSRGKDGRGTRRSYLPTSRATAPGSLYRALPSVSRLCTRLPFYSVNSVVLFPWHPRPGAVAQRKGSVAERSKALD